MKKQMATGAVLAGLSVALGAYGAHGLKSQIANGLVTLDQVNGFDTAARYQMYHAIAILFTGIIGNTKITKLLKWANICFIIGIVFFSGSLYLLTTRGITGMEWLKVLGPITPIGGLFFIAGWICLATDILKRKNPVK